MQMGDSLLSSVMRLITPQFFKMASQFIGGPQEQETAKLGFISAVPTVLSGIMKKGSTLDGSGHLIDMIRDDNYDSGVPENYLDHLKGGKITEKFLEKGLDTLTGIFGNDLNATTAKLASSIGANQATSSKILSLIAPLVMGTLGAKIKKIGMNPASLFNLLKEEKKSISGEGDEELKPQFTRELKETTEATPFEYAAEQTPKSKHRMLVPMGIAALLLGSFLYFNKDREGMKEQAGTAGNVTEINEKAAPENSPPEIAPVQKITTVEQISQFLARGSDSELPKKFHFDDLSFYFGSVQLTPESLKTLDDLAVVLANHPTAQVKLEGSTDNIGTEESNQKISIGRAEEVKNYLVDHGVDQDEISTFGTGDSNPIASNDTEQGRMKNRRIDLVVIKR